MKRIPRTQRLLLGAGILAGTTLAPVDLWAQKSTARASSCPPAWSCVGDGAAEAAGSEPAPITLARKRARAVRLAGPAPQLDGRLDDAAWQSAVFVSDFESTRVTEQTEVAFLYDEKNLWIGARMRTADPTAVRALVSRRDEPGTAESFAVSLDTHRDRRTAYTFEVTAGGARLDYHHPEDRLGARDYAWDPVWEARAGRDSAGWTVEIRIPFSQLRFQRPGAQIWGLNLVRRIPAQNRTSFWVRVRREEGGWASRFGDLVGIAGVRPRLGVELLPYVAAETVIEERDAPDPLESTDVYGRVGGDARVTLPALTLDLTVNPDFGQVEADPAEVNLSAFETFFPERRPFFIGASSALNGQGPRYFYSRRIGAPPRGPAAGDFVDRPESTTILGAARFAARGASGMSFQGLAALSSRERARAFDEGTGTIDEVEVEPRALFVVGRIEELTGVPASTIGVSWTAVQRDLEEDEGLAGILARRALAGGADFTVRPSETPYEVRGHFGMSHVAGEPAAMLRLQQSSARYYQRPDARHVHLDPSSESIVGFSGGLRAARVAGTLLWHVGATARTPGFEINDAGLLSTADRIETTGGLLVYAYPKASMVRRVGFGVHGDVKWNFGGDRQEAAPGAGLDVRWANDWRTYLDVTHETPALSDKLTRGGPLMATPRAWNLTAGLVSDYGARFQWQTAGSARLDDLEGRSFSLSSGLSWQGGARWRLSFFPGFDWQVDTRQFFAALENGGAATFGKRYVFATVDHRSAYVQLRLDVAVTPDLTLESYAEPFASSGRFRDFGELVAPRTNDLLVYGTEGTTLEQAEDGEWQVHTTTGDFTLDDRDFDIRSFRSNLVVRWEWWRGSTLFLVWQRDQFGFGDDTREIEPGSFANVLANSIVSGASANTLAAKLTFWLPLN